MALWSFSNLNKYGTLRTRIVHIPDGMPLTIGRGFGPLIQASRFKYEYTNLFAPTLYTALDGQKYIIPTWQKVVPGTTLNDITWNKVVFDKPEIPEKTTWKFPSDSNPDVHYFVKQNGSKYTCTCSGFWRVKDKNKGCKHIQKVKGDK